jgi:hypothetical protein
MEMLWYLQLRKEAILSDDILKKMDEIKSATKYLFIQHSYDYYGVVKKYSDLKRTEKDIIEKFENYKNYRNNYFAPEFDKKN